MPRFYLPPAQCSGDSLCLLGREAHHARHVLRLACGDRATVLDGVGTEYRCEIRALDRDKILLAIQERRSQPAPSCPVTLLQALPKGKLIESIVQKATELGVSRIVPLLSERAVVRLDAGEAALKAEKWQQTAVEAIKQCGALWLPRIETPVSPHAFLARRETFELAMVGSLQAGSQHPRRCFEVFRQAHGRQPSSACVWVGPEGDFTPEEYRAIAVAGAAPITLGPLVLRAETAAIYCLSILSYELQAGAIPATGSAPETRAPGTGDASTS